MKKYWNYSTDSQPRDKANIGRVGDLFDSRVEAERECKRFCKSRRIGYEEAMVAEVTDIIQSE